jgi:hypothetical protein
VSHDIALRIGDVPPDVVPCIFSDMPFEPPFEPPFLPGSCCHIVWVHIPVDFSVEPPVFLVHWHTCYGEALVDFHYSFPSVNQPRGPWQIIFSFAPVGFVAPVPSSVSLSDAFQFQFRVQSRRHVAFPRRCQLLCNGRLCYRATSQGHSNSAAFQCAMPSRPRQASGFSV